MAIEIKVFKTKFLKDIKRLVQMLHPKWFDKEALTNIPKDIRLQTSLIACQEEKAIGFISFYAQDGRGKLGWVGVDPAYHRQGIGKALLQATEKDLKKSGIKNLEVKTVVEQDPKDGSYDETMKFYRHCGFKIKHKNRLKKEKGYTYRMGVLVKKL